MIEKIILAADGQDAWNAAATVQEIAETAGAGVEVEVLHVNEVEYQTPPEEGSGERDFCVEAKELVDAVVEDLQRHGVAAWGHIRSGVYDDVADDIVAEARETGADVIVVGRRERSDLSRWIMGSVSRGVERRAECQVLVVRETRVKV